MNGRKKVAVEIETGNSDFIKNIERDSRLFDEVICVAVNKEVEERIKRELSEESLKRVVITSVFDIRCS